MLTFLTRDLVHVQCGLLQLARFGRNKAYTSAGQKIVRGCIER